MIPITNARALLQAEIDADDAEILADDASWDREREFVPSAMFDAEAEYASRFGGGR